jgi:uncharacterized protein (DUF1330 family)
VPNSLLQGSAVGRHGHRKSVINRSALATSDKAQARAHRETNVMNQRITIGLALLAGAALGAAGVEGIHAQAKPPVYYVAEIDVSNPEAYAAEYAPKAQALIKSHGGRQLAIGGSAAAGATKLTAFDGEPPKRAVVQVWDSMDKVQAWRNDPQYKALREVGNKYAKFRSYAIEGLPQ